MKIAIIGSGISGLSCAWKLSTPSNNHNITVFEANPTLGGHTATVDVSLDESRYAIDTGFIVYNQRTYPHFIALLDELGLQGQPTEMSFSVRNPDSGLEYNGHSLNTLFAQRRNLFRPSFWRFILEILRFNRLCKQRLKQPMQGEETLSDLLNRHGFSSDFALHYVLPMGAAIWSSSLDDMANFPLTLFLRFFDNHGLLDIANRPQWMVVPGGSREYIRRMQSRLPPNVELLTNMPVNAVKRQHTGVSLATPRGVELFDQVIFACHADQALRLLGDEATADEQQVLGALPYQSNEVVLHTDISTLPRSKRAWASWNYLLPSGANGTSAMRQCQANVTYNMNILQGINCAHTFCVSLNPMMPIDASKILLRQQYSHPVISLSSIAAQQQRQKINGLHRSWFCGAYWYNGFHEDGVRSALDVVEQLTLQEAS